MSEWYDTIEPGIRPIVRLLRDNGINTTCSCEHTMRVEADWQLDEELRVIYGLLCEQGYVFEIIAHWDCSLCTSSRRLEILITGKRGPCPAFPEAEEAEE